VRHDVIAFLTNVNEYVGDAGRYIHLGMTSSDMLDTALSLQLVDSLQVIMIHVENLIQAIRYKAQEHRDTVMIGRSHGIHAEPITFGFKLAGWLAEMLRHRERLTILQDRIAVGQISGAVGTYANIDPKIEALACQKLGLNPDTASTQVISRDIHAEFMNALALLGLPLSGLPWKFATCSAPTYWKWKNFSLKSRRDLRPCPTSATPLSQSG
jgi:adenylosuccinate lyase